MRPGKGAPRNKKLGRVGRLSVREMAHLYHLEGREVPEIAALAGVTDKAIYAAFRRYEIPMKAPHPRKRITRDDILRGIRRGWTKSRLARDLGVTRVSVARAQKRLGIAWPARDGNTSPV